MTTPNRDSSLGLIEKLSRELKPVKPLPSLNVQMAWVGGILTVMAAALLWVVGLRHNLGILMGEIGFWTDNLILTVILFISLYQILFLSRPQLVVHPRALRWAQIGVGAWVSFRVGMYVAHIIQTQNMGKLAPALYCASWVPVVGLVLMAILLLGTHLGYTTQKTELTRYAPMVAVSFSALTLQFHCYGTHPAHLISSHAMPLVVSIIPLQLLGRLLFSIMRRFQQNLG